MVSSYWLAAGLSAIVTLVSVMGRIVAVAVALRGDRLRWWSGQDPHKRIDRGLQSDIRPCLFGEQPLVLEQVAVPLDWVERWRDCHESGDRRFEDFISPALGIFLRP